MKFDSWERAAIKKISQPPEVPNDIPHPKPPDPTMVPEVMPELVGLTAARATDPLLGVNFNPAQVRLIEACRNPNPNSLTLVLMLKGNRAGGSYALVACWSAIMFGTRDLMFSGSPFAPNWPFLRSARLVAPIKSLEDKGPLQKAMLELFPRGAYSQNRGSGHGYNSQGSTTKGWGWDTITTDQQAIQAAGANLGLVVGSEPPPRDIFVECMTRLSGQGLLIWEMTRLDMAEFIDEYIDAGALLLDGRKVGEIRVVEADIHDSCLEHCGGHRPHSAIEAIIASWPSDEREARQTGKKLRLSGRIYPTYGDHNEISELTDYHQQCWDQGSVRIANCIDPHDARPWCIAWFACFPNQDVVAFAEWPNFDFRSCKVSPVTDIEDYRALIAETEAFIGKPVVMRFMDSGHMYTPGKGTAKTLDIMLRGPCRKCLIEAGATLTDDEQTTAYHAASERCTHKLVYQGWPVYSGSINAGHILVRPHLGDPTRGIPTKFFVMDTCLNLRYGMRHYAYKVEKNPEKAASERASFVNKDWPDLVRGGYAMGWQDWPAEVKPLNTSPLRTGAPADPSIKPKPEYTRGRIGKVVKGLNLNTVRTGGYSNPEPRRM
jgi:hypothetical protein